MDVAALVVAAAAAPVAAVDSTFLAAKKKKLVCHLARVFTLFFFLLVRFGFSLVYAIVILLCLALSCAMYYDIQQHNSTSTIHDKRAREREKERDRGVQATAR